MPPVAVQARTSSSPTEPAKGISQQPGPAPQAQPPARGEDEQNRRGTESKLNFLKRYLHVGVVEEENELMPRVQPPPLCLLPPPLLPSHTRAHTRLSGRVSALRPRAGMGVFISEEGRTRGAR